MRRALSRPKFGFVSDDVPGLAETAVRLQLGTVRQEQTVPEIRRQFEEVKPATPARLARGLSAARPAARRRWCARDPPRGPAAAAKDRSADALAGHATGTPTDVP